MLVLIRRGIALIFMLALAACGDDSGHGGSAPILTGQLIGGSGAYPGAVAGMHFRSRSQSGFTDAGGGFTYVDGESITFGVADVSFRPAAGAPLISPWQLAADGGCEQTAELERLLVLLHSLDLDGDPDNGLALVEVDATARSRSFATLSEADITALVSELIPGRSPVDAGTAVDSFITQMDGEVWEQIGIDAFPLLTGLVRSQGLTTDGSAWFFSWRLGLERTDFDYAVELSKTTVIPPEIARLGGNHIGDIDYWNGKLYAPIEDGTEYLHPHLVLYDPATFMPTTIHPLADVPLTDGVPWVAVDGPRGNIYVAVWDPTPEIFVLDLTTLQYEGSIPLRTTLGRIQGAKVFEGSLYASTDNDAKDIFKINLDTGTVIPLFAFHQPFEEEGLVFLPRPDGSLLHTLNVSIPVPGTELRHHRRTRDPLRLSVCPSLP